jgi:ribosome-associated translation inhibitor RaiA
MTFRFHGNATDVEGAHEIVEREAERVDRHFADVDEDLKLLDVGLHYHEKTDSYQVKLVFHAPDRQLAADGHATKLGMAIRRAFDDLYDRVDEYLAKVRSEPEIRREQIAQREAEERSRPER